MKLVAVIILVLITLLIFYKMYKNQKSLLHKPDTTYTESLKRMDDAAYMDAMEQLDLECKVEPKTHNQNAT